MKSIIIGLSFAFLLHGADTHEAELHKAIPINNKGPFSRQPTPVLCFSLAENAPDMEYQPCSLPGSVPNRDSNKCVKRPRKNSLIEEPRQDRTIPTINTTCSPCVML